MTVAIYGLFHGEHCAYVGKSYNPERRLLAHRGWFRRRFGTAPRLEILERVPTELAGQAERDQIQRYRKIGAAEMNVWPLPPKRNRKIKVSISIRDEVLNWLKQKANRQSRSVSWLVNQMLKELL